MAKNSSVKAALILVAGGLLAGTAVSAEWTGATSTDWFTTGNWTPNLLPTATDDVFINIGTFDATAIGAVGAVSQNISIGTQQGMYGTLEISGGGTLVTNGTAMIGGGHLLSGDSYGDGWVDVMGTGSLWTVTGALNLGGDDIIGYGDAALTISDGGRVEVSGPVRLIEDLNYANITVTGSGSALVTGDFTASTWVGSLGVAVSDGGSLTTAGGQVGTTMMVNGAGSSWTSTADTTLGLGTSTGRLTLYDGGVANFTNLTVGNGGPYDGGFVVNGVGSRLNVAGTLRIAPELTNISVSAVMDGGVVSVGGGSGTIAIGADDGAAGVLLIGDFFPTAPGEIEAAAVSLAAGSGVVFNHDSTGHLFRPQISGAGTVLVIGGTTIFAADNTYTGGTLIAGVLQLGTGGTSGGIVGEVDFDPGSTLIIDRSNTIALDGDFFGIGEIIKRGAGQAVFGGDGSGLSGALAVQGGGVRINGNFSDTTVDLLAGTTLGGSGVTGAVMVASGASIAPGNSIGTLTVASVNFAAGSTFEVETSGSAADLLRVLGTATISAGATVVVRPTPGSYVIGQTFSFLEAGALVGTFGSIVDSSAFVTFALDQSVPNQVRIKVIDVRRDFVAVATTDNQKAAAGALELRPVGDPLVAAILALSAAQARAAFDALSGDVYPSLQGALIETARHPREAALDRVTAAFAAIEGAGQGPNLWVRGLGAQGVITSSANASAFGLHTGGLMVGADGLTDGGLLGGGFVQVGATRLGGNGTARSTDFGLGAYGGTSMGQVSVAVGGSAALHALSFSRNVVFPGFTDTNGATATGLSGQVFGELAYAFALEGATLTPFVRLAGLGTSGFAINESGGAAALSGTVAGSVAALVNPGLRGETVLTIGDDTPLRVHGMIGIEQVVAPTPTAALAFAGGAPFTIAGASPVVTSLMIGGGASAAFGHGLTLGFDASSRFGATTSGALSATLAGQL